VQYEILVDHGETANKCTVLPLRYRSDFLIRRFKKDGPVKAFRADFLLHPDGDRLDQMPPPASGTACVVGLIDCVWRRLAPIISRLEGPLPPLVRIPDGFVTAYPRKALPPFDPHGGLATIEALFIGAAFLGNWDETLLSEYFFGSRFLSLNRQLFEQFGLWPDGRDESVSLYQPQHPRSAQQRRIGRGRAGPASR